MYTVKLLIKAAVYIRDFCNEKPAFHTQCFLSKLKIGSFYAGLRMSETNVRLYHLFRYLLQIIWNNKVTSGSATIFRLRLILGVLNFVVLLRSSINFICQALSPHLDHCIRGFTVLYECS